MEKKVDRFKPIEVNTHSEFFDCQCMSNEHMVRFMYFEDSFEKENSYSADIGSGVKDIYQNCYNPSLGPCEDDSEGCSCGIEGCL